MKLKFFDSDAVEDSEVQKAFRLWLSKLNIRENELILQTTFKLDYPQQPSWLKYARESSLLSIETVANKLNVSRNNYYKFEQNEAAGSITINSLKKAAEALDSELVYFIRPKTKFTYAQTIWRKILPFALRLPRLKNAKKNMKHAALSANAIDLMKDTDFRQQQGWVRQRF